MIWRHFVEYDENISNIFSYVINRAHSTDKPKEEMQPQLKNKY